MTFIPEARKGGCWYGTLSKKEGEEEEKGEAIGPRQKIKRVENRIKAMQWDQFAS